MEFDWDEKKASSNLKKHGVSFDEAVTIFFSPLTRTFVETASAENWIAVGYSAQSRILLVVFCERQENIIRIISARRATAHEKKDYEEGI